LLFSQLVVRRLCKRRSGSNQSIFYSRPLIYQVSSLHEISQLKQIYCSTLVSINLYYIVVLIFLFISFTLVFPSFILFAPLPDLGYAWSWRVTPTLFGGWSDPIFLEWNNLIFDRLKITLYILFTQTHALVQHAQLSMNTHEHFSMH